MWLLELSIRQAIENAELTGIGMPTADQQAQYEAAQISAMSGRDMSRLLSVAGATAEIAVQGVLTKTPSFMAMLFGGGNTTYTEIVSAIAEAEANPDVSNIVFAIDSPGGNIDGLFETLDAIHGTTKPTEAKVSNVAASAAYAIASQAGKINAVNNAARIGSIGILASFRVDKNKVDITSTNAPKKAPDISTAEGQAVVREELDGIHNLFVDAIARGRGATAKDINSNFGQGATLLAGEALKRGMIDGINKVPLKVVDNANSQTAANGGANNEGDSMKNVQELQAQHPDVYSAAVQVGIDQERDRVNAHLHMGKEAGAMDIAVKAIEDGDGFTATINAKYLSAGMNRTAIDERGDDDKDAGDATADAGDGGDGAGANADTDAEIVAGAVEKSLGVVANA